MTSYENDVLTDVFHYLDELFSRWSQNAAYSNALITPLSWLKELWYKAVFFFKKQTFRHVTRGYQQFTWCYHSRLHPAVTSILNNLKGIICIHSSPLSRLDATRSPVRSGVGSVNAAGSGWPLQDLFQHWEAMKNQRYKPWFIKFSGFAIMRQFYMKSEILAAQRLKPWRSLIESNLLRWDCPFKLWWLESLLKTHFFDCLQIDLLNWNNVQKCQALREITTK